MDCRAMSGEEPEGKLAWKLYPRVAGTVQTHRHRVDAVHAEPGQQQVVRRTKTFRHRSTAAASISSRVVTLRTRHPGRACRFIDDSVMNVAAT
jgi:hypothetical protein